MKIMPFFGLSLVGVLTLGACSPAPSPAPTQDLTAIHTHAAQIKFINHDLQKNRNPDLPGGPVRLIERILKEAT